MTLPFAFLLGLAVLFAERELAPPITGSGRWEVLLSFALLLAVPAALALGSLRGVRRELVLGRRERVPPRALLRLSALATPVCMHLVAGPGGWSDLAVRLAGDSRMLDMALLLTPLLLAELPRLVLATAAELHLEFAPRRFIGTVVALTALPGLGELLPIVRGRLGWPLLLAMPCVLFGGAVDLLQSDREHWALFVVTTPGATAGTLVFFAFLSMLLPYWFRVAFGVVRGLPEPAGAVLRRTAAALGFPPRAVLFLPTGMRAMNAMMVGPLPVGRFLCVTDGLVGTLDLEALTGVVAHEVGHARRGHPLILMTLAAIVPLLLPAPLRVLQLDRLDAGGQALLALAAVLVLWAIVRTVSHRFEHEADAASVDALGAGPCTRALLAVSRAALPVSGMFRRHFTLHPEEPRRLDFMRRYEEDSAFRRAFRRRGRLLRLGVAAVLAVAVAAAAWAWQREWPFERALWRFYAGDFAGAAAAVERIGDDVPAHWQETWPRFRDELAAALELAPNATTWPEAQAALVPAAWSRGVSVLLRDGPAAARPWFALALEAGDGPLVQGAIYDFCAAAADNDPERMNEAAAIVRRLGPPPELAAVFEPPTATNR